MEEKILREARAYSIYYFNGYALSVHSKPTLMSGKFPVVPLHCTMLSKILRLANQVPVYSELLECFYSLNVSTSVNYLQGFSCGNFFKPINSDITISL